MSENKFDIYKKGFYCKFSTTSNSKIVLPQALLINFPIQIVLELQVDHYGLG